MQSEVWLNLWDTNGAIVQKANAMYAKGDLQHALMFFYGVKKLTRERDMKPNLGIQLCLDSINSAGQKSISRI